MSYYGFEEPPHFCRECCGKCKSCPCECEPEVEMHPCEMCGKRIPFEPQYCCSGIECGCMGMPVEPCICSKECWASFPA